jgi:hypothetical protein
MTPAQQLNQRQTCEKIFVEGKKFNDENNCLASESAVADRLLARGIELEEAYKELHDTLERRWSALKCFLDLLLSTAIIWNPEKMMEARAGRSELAEVNQQIANLAAKLAALMERRSHLHNESGFSSDTHYHVCEVIEAAAKHNHRFKSYVQQQLSALHLEYGPMYWPSLSEFLQVLAFDARNTVIQATDPMTAAGTKGTRPSRADFFKALFVGIEQNSTTFGQLPSGFKLSDKTLASLANCALDLDVDDLVDEAYVKRLRQRERDGTQ